MVGLSLKVFGWIVLFYCALLALTLGYQQTASAHQSTISLYRDYPRSIYANTAHYAVYGLNRLEESSRQIFILGASVPGHAFEPDIIMQELPGWKVDNLSVSGSNITQIEQVVELLENEVDLSRLDRSVFVIGGHFVSLLDDQRKFGGPTKITVEKLRHHLYTDKNGRVAPLFVGRAMKTARFLISPFALIYKLKFEIYNQINSLKVAAVNLVRRTVPDAQRGEDAAYYRGLREKQFHYRMLGDGQVDELRKLVDRLEARGAKVVYVDMPVPTYFRSGFPIFANYREKVGIIRKDKRIAYFDMTAFAGDDQFLDDAHPKEKYAPLWSKALADFLKKELSQKPLPP